MGRDVTFHPISPDELRHMLFDVLRDPSLARARSNEISYHADRTELYQTYQEVLEMVARVRQGEVAGGRLAYAAAAIAGYLHPYWYERGTTFADVASLRPLVTSVHDVARELDASWAGDRVEQVGESYTGGGYLGPDEVRAAWDAVRADGGAPPGLVRALDYARARGLGVLEATDVYDPGADATASLPHHVRGAHLDNLDDTSVRRVPAARIAALARGEIGGDLQMAQYWVTPSIVDELAGAYATLTDWSQRRRFVQVIGSVRSPAIRPIMEDVLRAPTPDGADARYHDWERALALAYLTAHEAGIADSFQRWYDDERRLTRAAAAYLAWLDGGRIGPAPLPPPFALRRLDGTLIEEVRGVFRLEDALADCVARGVALDRLDLRGQVLQDVDLSGAKLAGCSLRGGALFASLAGADLAGADLRELQESSVDFTGANLRGADLSGAELIDCAFDGADLTDAKLEGVELGAAPEDDEA